MSVPRSWWRCGSRPRRSGRSRRSSARSAPGGGPIRCSPSRRASPGVLSFEPGEGGRLIETRASGKVFEIGKIRAWEPPHRLVFGWRQATFAPGQDTEVEVRFEPVGEETRVTVEHLGWDSVPAAHVARHGFPNAGLPHPSCRVVAGAAWRRTRPASRTADERGGGPGPWVAASAAPPRGRQAAFGFIFATAVMNALSFGLMIPVLPSLIRSFFGERHLDRPGGRLAVRLRRHLGRHAVHLRPGAGHAVRPVRAPAGAADLDLRPLARLPGHGLRADPGVAAARPGAERGDRRQLLHRQRLCRRHLHAREARPQLRLDELGVQRRLPARTDRRRHPRPRTPSTSAASCSTASVCRSWWRRCSARSTGSTVCWCCRSRCRRSGGSRRSTGGAPIRWRASGYCARTTTCCRWPAINFLFQLAQQVLPNIFVLYTQLRYHWSLSFLGITFLITGALGIVVQSLVVGPVVRRIGERGAVIAGAAGRHDRFRDLRLRAVRLRLLLRHADLRADGADAAGAAGPDDAARDGRASRGGCRAPTSPPGASPRSSGRSSSR